MRKILTSNGKLLSKNGNLFTVTANEGTPIQIETSEEMQSSLVSSNVGKIFLYNGESNEEFINGELYQVIEED